MSFVPFSALFSLRLGRSPIRSTLVSPRIHSRPPLPVLRADFLSAPRIRRRLPWPPVRNLRWRVASRSLSDRRVSSRVLDAHVRLLVKKGSDLQWVCGETPSAVADLTGGESPATVEGLMYPVCHCLGVVAVCSIHSFGNPWGFSLSPPQNCLVRGRTSS